MKGYEQIIDALNARLADELAAINQYVVHHSLLDLWGYHKLAPRMMQHAKQEMGHAHRLIERIVFLDGVPVVDKLGPVHLGMAVPEMLARDAVAEGMAIDGYNATAALALAKQDSGTHLLVQGILADEEGHLEYLDGEQVKLEQMGLQNYLGTLV